MKFRFDINVTEEDYLEFNKFCLFRSHYGRKNVTKIRAFSLLIVCFIGLTSLISQGFSRDNIVAVVVVMMIAIVFWFVLPRYQAFFLKGQTKMMKKTGKLPFSPVSVIEFYDDKIVEITETSRTEQNYAAVERISLVDGKMIYIHLDSMRAYIIPVLCLGAEYDALVEFISSKCAVIDKY